MSNPITLERIFDATLEDVWELWTTQEGIESWWGPDGFEVKVRKLELRVGGSLDYAMTATASLQVEFMKKAGMPLTTEAHLEYTEVTPLKVLAYRHRADFIPGKQPYNVSYRVELFAVDGGVKMLLTMERMHDEEWTRRAVMGWESELGRLKAVLAKRQPRH